jgi:predicted secreted protein
MAERGQDYTVTADGTALGFLRTKELTRNLDTIDTSSDDNPDFASFIAGQRNWGLTGEALYVFDDAGQQIIEAAMVELDGTPPSNDPIEFVFEPLSAETGQLTYTGNGFVTEATLEASTNEVVMYSLSIQGTGTLAATAAV